MILKRGDRVCTVYGVEVQIISIRDDEIEAVPVDEAEAMRRDFVENYIQEVDNNGTDGGRP